MDYDDFAMYPFDEMLPDEFYQLAKFVKEEVDPRIRFFANSRGDPGGREMERIAPYVDIWWFRDVPCSARLGAAEQRLRTSGAEIWSYDCRSTAKGRPPYGYYRLQMWRAFARGDRGCGFWTYTDPGPGNGDAWDDYRTMDGMFGVVYGQTGKPTDVELSDEHIITSRRWEAWREGVEDFEYLVTLRNEIEKARRAGRHSDAERADTTLMNAVKRVTENPGEVGEVYHARREITDQIIKLRNAESR
jgi:hypothetical protein